MQALSKFSDAGNLRGFFAEHEVVLQEIVKAGMKDRPAVFAFIALAGIGSPSADEFILQHWETAGTDQQAFACTAAMNRIAPRVMAAQEHRIAPALFERIDRGELLQHNGLILLSLQLSKSKCVEALRLAIPRVPKMETGVAQGLENIIARVEAGETDALIKEHAELQLKGAVGAYAIRTMGRFDLTKLK